MLAMENLRKAVRTILSDGDNRAELRNPPDMFGDPSDSDEAILDAAVDYVCSDALLEKVGGLMGPVRAYSLLHDGTDVSDVQVWEATSVWKQGHASEPVGPEDFIEVPLIWDKPAAVVGYGSSWTHGGGDDRFERYAFCACCIDVEGNVFWVIEQREAVKDGDGGILSGVVYRRLAVESDGVPDMTMDEVSDVMAEPFRTLFWNA